MFWFSVFFFKTLNVSSPSVDIITSPPPFHSQMGQNCLQMRYAFPPRLLPSSPTIPFGFQAWSIETHLTEVTRHLSVTKSSGYFSTFDIIDCAIFLKYYFISPLTSWFSLTSQTECHRYLNLYNSQNWIHSVTFFTYFFFLLFTSFSSVSQSRTQRISCYLTSIVPTPTHTAILSILPDYSSSQSLILISIINSIALFISLCSSAYIPSVPIPMWFTLPSECYL